MFCKTDTNHQLNMFSSTNTFLTGSRLKTYEDDNSWHNLFYDKVVLRIDEEVFRPLFCNDNGAPNSSIRLLIGMMILKEAHGISDAKLFEDCEFNLLTRRALGLFNMDDSIPAASTYYLLRKRIVEWEKASNENLMEKVFSQVTRSQIIEFKINGKNVRMDSKLLGSNIAWYSRYELIHETLRKAYPDIKGEIANLSLNALDINLLESVLGESGDKVSYRSNKAEIESKIAELGILIYKIISGISNHSSESLQILSKVFSEQYFKDEDIILPLPKEKISASSIQSPHDTDCHYRQKGDNQVKGYSINISETCDGDGSLNLVTNVQVDVCSTADCDFLQPSIESTQEILSQKIETVHADGAYHSVDNQDYCKEKNIDLVLGGIQGQPPRYDLELNEENELIITDLQTGSIIPCRMAQSRKEGSMPKWTIRDENGKYRYFTQKEIDTCSLRKQINARTQTELNIRNNVETSIFQLGYHFSNNKSRYRGLSRHKIWANVRCLWVNFVRIMNFIARNVENCLQKLKYSLNLSQNWQNFAQFVFGIFILGNLCSIYQKINFTYDLKKWTFRRGLKI